MREPRGLHKSSQLQSQVSRPRPRWSDWTEFEPGERSVRTTLFISGVIPEPSTESGATSSPVSVLSSAGQYVSSWDLRTWWTLRMSC